MKNAAIKLTGVVLIITSLATKTIKESEDKINKTVIEFVEAGDHRDADKLNKVLHKDFRAVVNRLFGSEEVSIMNKDLYLDLIKQGKIGGDNRKVDIVQVDINHQTASVKAVLTGKEYVFTTHIQLVEDIEGNWTVINDMPFIEKKELK